MINTVTLVLFIGVLAWVFDAIRPPPPRICGYPGGPPITGPRIKLRDGRYLAYKEHGVSKELAKYKVVLVHGFASSRHEAAIETAEAVQELGVYFVSFHRPGYGESDPDPKRSYRSMALDIQELADQLECGSKFYVIGFSMGGQVVWGCLNYISHRYDPRFKVAVMTHDRDIGHDRAGRYRASWSCIDCSGDQLLVAWLPIKLIYRSILSTVPTGPVGSSGCPLRPVARLLVEHTKVVAFVQCHNWKSQVVAPGFRDFIQAWNRPSQREYVTQQGEFESFDRELMIGFGECEFDPMDLKNPFADGEGSVHLWHGVEDAIVPVTLQRYIVEKLPWIHYHEIPDAGHLFSFVDGMKEAILKELLAGEN